MELNSKTVPIENVPAELRKLAKAGITILSITLHPSNPNVVTLMTVSDDTGPSAISDKPDRSFTEELHDI